MQLEHYASSSAESDIQKEKIKRLEQQTNKDTPESQEVYTISNGGNMFGFKKKTKYNVLPAIGHSYVMDEKTNEPLLTYFRPNSGLFCSTPLKDDKFGFFLNIRRPVVFDVLGVTSIMIPDDLPPECDGIIFINYGTYRIKSFYVKDPKTQTWRVDI